ncbi:MAG: FixH family protein [Thermodesulfovibrionales bacterium]
MKRSSALTLIVLSIVALLSFLNPASAADKPLFTKHFNESLFNITEKGLFSVEILMDDKEYPQLGKGLIGLVIHNQANQDVEGAEITLTSVMPEGQSSTDTPAVKDKGKGLYTVSNLSLKKEGKWELRIGVKKKTKEDTASFQFPNALNTPIKKGKYSAD